MTTEELTLWIQAAAVVAAVGAAIIALIVSALDRRNARAIAAKDRAVNIKQAKLMFELEALLRLGQNLRRGGHIDKTISRDMAAEAGALIGAIGEKRLPRNWDKGVQKDDDGLIEYMNEESTPEWKRDSVEVQLALNAVSEELGQLIAAQDAEAR